MSAAPSDPIIGIDLGTTNSLVAVAGWPAASGPRVLADEMGRNMLPSVVRFGADGKVAEVGYEAKQRAVEFPLSTISSVKRLMGRSIRDAAADIPYLSFRVVEGAQNTARVEVAIGGEDARASGPAKRSKVVSPQEVSAIILRRLKEQASLALGVEVRRAVVTVPAYFDDAQRQATRDAGRLAGLEVVRIVNEPTAAALAYGLGLREAAGAASEPRVVVVYDLGGGTFDVSVLKITPGEGVRDQGIMGSRDRGGKAVSSLDPMIPHLSIPSVSDFFQVLSRPPAIRTWAAMTLIRRWLGCLCGRSGSGSGRWGLIRGRCRRCGSSPRAAASSSRTTERSRDPDRSGRGGACTGGRSCEEELEAARSGRGSSGRSRRASGRCGMRSGRLVMRRWRRW